MSIECFYLFSKYYICLFTIYINSDTFYLKVNSTISYHFHKFFRMMKFFCIYDKAYHNFTSCFSHSCKYMPHYSFVLFFIICRYFILFHKFKNSLNYLFVTFMLYKTVRLWYNTVCSSCIKSCNKISVFVISDRKLCFISIMNRSIHP